ncbi:MAG TPA: DNA primase [Gammaproteobacteria bacterium]|nr:DNA primase [Gammaproteobacteria bacterium]
MAGRIPQAFIDELLSRIDIVDVISARLPLKKSGSNYAARCPFHNEKTPSFTVSQSKQFYHCFGCQEHGTAISFVMHYDNLHFVDAVEMLAESVGLDVPREQADQKRVDSRKPLYALMQRCADYYYTQLKASETAINYLKKRELSGETAKKFGIGYAPSGWQNLDTLFSARDTETLQKLGMLIRNDAGRVYDRFRDRVMFPIRDRRGRVIAFGGRILEQGEPKYLNSPETPLFRKGEELYGLFEARRSAQDQGTIVVVEGYMDVVSLSQHGVENCVATLGTATTSAHIETLFRIVPNIVFCFDADRAGREAAWRALKATLPALQDGRDAHFAFLPNGEDPDSFIASKGRATFEEFIRKANTATDFLLAHLSEDLNLDEVGGRARLAQLAKPLIESLPDGVYKQLTHQELEQRIGMALQQPTTSPETAAPSLVPQQAVRTTVSSHPTKASLLRRALALVLQKPSIATSLTNDVIVRNANSVGELMFSQVVTLCRENPHISTAGVLENFRTSPHFKGLGKLATSQLMPGDRDMAEETAEQELNDIMTKIQQLSSKTDSQLVAAPLRKGLLSIRKPGTNPDGA